MRTWKVIAYVAGGLLALVIIAMIAVALFFDPNHYKPQIERAVAEQTGRPFSLKGDLKLSFFPWLSVRLGPAELGEPAGFGEQPFLSIEEARLGIRLLPLLGGRFEVGEVRLDHPTVHLIVDAQGRNNWSGLGGKQKESETPSTKGSKPLAASIAGLEVRGAILTYEDRKTDQHTSIHDLDVKTGRISSGAPFDLAVEFAAEQGKDLSAKTQLKANITLDTAAQHYQLKDLSLAVNVQGPSYPAGGVPIELKAESLDVALEEQTLALNALTVDLAGARVSGALAGTKILDAPLLRGKLNLAPTSLRELMPKLGMKAPVTRDSNVLTRTSFEAEAAITKNSLTLDQLVMKLDETTATGRLAVTDFKTKALEFNLNVDSIDADRYRAPPPPKSEQPEKKEEPSAPVLLPVDTLRALNLRGQLSIGTAKFSGMTFSQLKFAVNAHDGDIRLEPASASMYGGQYRGTVQVDATPAVPRLVMDQHLAGVDFAPLLKDLYKTDRVAGRGSANIKVNGTGRDSAALINSLAGTLDFNVADGAILGIDIAYEISRAQALFKQQALPERSGPARTPFNTFRATGTIQNGVLTNKDLEIAAPVLKVTGQGTVDIAKETLNYRLTAAVLKPTDASATSQDLVGAAIPIVVTGPLSSPSIKPDVEGLVRDRAKKEIDKQKNKLEEKLRDKLKGILGGS